jgi:hypothetical protein
MASGSDLFGRLLERVQKGHSIAIPPISPNELDTPEAVAYPVEQHFGVNTILDIGRMDDYRNNQT